MVIKTKYDVGQEVWIKFPGITGKIIGIWVYQEDRIEYHIEWWDKETRLTAYFIEMRISPIKKRML